MESHHTVSARKFRPQTFGQVIGQRHIVRTLSNALEKGTFAHAYLFSGTRGVGKTTTARILAKALNCKDGPTATPCLECDNCREITAGSSLDVMEIDGASNTGVHNIRELTEKVKFTPSKSRFKIYIIDEVHQISKKAFDALLKTLEEPPAHVIFIFATTELNKVPDTILSRCQNFEYKTISMSDILAQLRMIADHEGIQLAHGAAQIIARRARGSMRDAQSMFDQAAAYGGGSVNDDDVKLILGLVDRSTLFSVTDAVIQRDRIRLLELTGEVVYSGADPGLFLEDLAVAIRNIMVAKLRPEGLEEFDDDEKEKFIQWAGALDYDEIQRFFSVITDTAERIKFSAQPALDLEMGLLRMTEKRGLANIDDLIATVDRAQAAVERAAPPTRAAQTDAPAQVVDSNVESAPVAIEQAVSGAGSEDLLALFKSARPMLMGIFESAAVQVKGDTVVIIVSDLHARDQLEDPAIKRLLEERAAQTLGRDVRVIVEYHDEKKNDDAAGRRKSIEREQAVRRQVMESPIIQSALEMFKGEVTEFKIIKHL